MALFKIAAIYIYTDLDKDLLPDNQNIRIFLIVFWSFVVFHQDNFLSLSSRLKEVIIVTKIGK